jgi:hypothetical protein
LLATMISTWQGLFIWYLPFIYNTLFSLRRRSWPFSSSSSSAS